MIITGCFFANGQNHDESISASTLLDHIKKANQIYTYQQKKLLVFEDIIHKQETQISSLNLSLDNCVLAAESSDKMTINLHQQIEQQNLIHTRLKKRASLWQNVTLSVVTYMIIKSILK